MQKAAKSDIVNFAPNLRTCKKGNSGGRIRVRLCERLRQVSVRVEPDGVLPPGDVDPDAPDAAPEVERDDEVAVLRAHC